MKINKCVFSIISFFLYLHVVGQNFSPHYSILSDSLDKADFQFLKNEIGKAQVVLLGETSHFEGGVFEIKAEIIKYLHEEMGFTTLAFESGTFSMTKAMQEIEKNKTGKEVFKKSLFGIWGNVNEFQSTASYYQEHYKHLKLFGFDLSPTGEYASNYLIDEVYQYLKRKEVGIPLSKLDFKLLFEGFEGFVFDEEIIQYVDFINMMDGIIESVKKKGDSIDDFYWKMNVQNMKAYAMLFDPNITEEFKRKDKEVYIKELVTLFDLDENNLIEIGLHGFFVGEGDNVRDEIMAENLLAYIEKFPNEKIVCWGANAHFINEMSSVDFPIIKDFKPMGSILKNELGDKLYSLAIVTASEEIDRNNILAKTPIQENSFEDFLMKINERNVFVSSGQEAMNTEKNVRFFSNKAFVKGNLNEFHDGYLFTEDVRPSTVLEENMQEDRYQKTNNAKIFSTQIVDGKTKEPLSYVNVIVEGSHIGTISDENGFLELDVQEKYQNGVILVSHLGYEELRMPYKKLNGVIELTASVFSLDEVVIRKRLSANEIMKNCVKRFRDNYPDHKMSFKRHFQVAVNKGDSLLFDLEFITQGHNKGYHRHWRTINELREYKWNKRPKDEPVWIQEFIYISENSIMDGKYLQARKWKKFDFISKEPILMNDRWVYVVDFKTDKDFYTYTNRRTKSIYSGTLYIDQEDFGIVKVKENWKFDNPIYSKLKSKDSLKALNELNTGLRALRHKGWAKSYYQSFIHHETQITTYQKANNEYYYQKSNDLLTVGTLINNEEQQKYIEATRIDFYDYVIKNPEVFESDNKENWQFKYHQYNSEFWKKNNQKGEKWFLENK